MKSFIHIFTFFILLIGQIGWIPNKDTILTNSILIDSDGDGIDDNIDLDDDNDGIPDAIECGEIYCGENVTNGGFEDPIVVTGTWSPFHENSVPGWRTTASDRQIELWNTGFMGVTAVEGSQFAELNANQVSSLYQELCISGGSTVRWSVKHRGRDGVDVANVKIGASLASASVEQRMSDGTGSWGSYSGTYVVPDGQDTTFFVFEAVSTASGNNTSGNFIDDIAIIILNEPTCSIDTDGDGIINSLDLDSDNDGIYDVVEAGNGALDANNDGIIDDAAMNSGTNGLYDGVEIPGSGILNYTVIDSDGDGEQDAYELDSDDDGCFDAVEAGYTDADNNGLLGSDPVTSDTQGLVTSGTDGYTTPLDGDTNTILDFQEAGVALSIVTQPVNQTDCETETIVFSVESSLPSVTTFQWEEDTGSGIWNTITDTGSYSGTTTNTLTVSNAPVTLNSYKYRVNLNHLSYKCDVELISNEVVLTLNPLPIKTQSINNPVICLNETANITIPNSQLNISYQLRLDTDNSNVGTPLLGTGADLNFSINPNTSATYNILATNTDTNCNIQLDNKSTVTVYSIPQDNLTFDNEEVCIGDTISLILENSELGIQYQLQLDSDGSNVGAPIIGTGGNITFNVSPTLTTTYRLLSTNTTTNCSIVQTNKSMVTVHPLPVLKNTIVELKQCDDDTDAISLFNLTEADVLISDNHINETITYYESRPDAEARLDPILNFTAYPNQVALNDVIYARVETINGCYRTVRIDLVVGVSQIPTSFVTLQYYECDTKEDDNDNTNGVTTFDFSDAEQTIKTLFPLPHNFTVTFYNNEADALAELNVIDASNHRNEGYLHTQDIYVRIDSDDVNACLGLGHHITLTVDPLPIAQTITNYPLCSDTNEANFDLRIKTPEVIGTQTRPILVTYHESEQDAIDNIPIATPESYVATSKTIYVRAQFDDNNNGVLDARECINTDMSFDLVVNPNPVLVQPDPIRICSEQVNTIYDLTIREDQITNNDSSISLAYYETPLDITNDTPINNPTAYPNTQLDRDIIVLATGSNSCTSTIVLSLKTILYVNLNENPVTLEECEIDNDGYDNFDIRRRETDILNGLDEADFTFTYYEHEPDAILGNSNVIQNPENFTNEVQYTQTIYARVQPIANECYQVISITLIVNPVPEIGIEPEYVICLDAMSQPISPTSITFLPNPPIDTGLSITEYTFQWYNDAEGLPGNEILGATNPIYIPIGPGDYTVIATNRTTGCTIPATTKVVESYPPESITVDLVSDAFSGNNVLKVNVVGNGAYEYRLDYTDWQTDNRFENLRGGERTIYVRDLYNCNEISAMKVVVDYPKYFTPNGDGTNDTWNIRGINTQPNAQVYIFNRYGKLLKQLNPIGPGWNGTFNGRLMPVDDYWFTVEYIEPRDNTLKIFKSHFTLKR